jgi:hypothetical protein
MAKAQQTGGLSGKWNANQEVFAGLSMKRYSSEACKKSGLKEKIYLKNITS